MLVFLIFIAVNKIHAILYVNQMMLVLVSIVICNGNCNVLVESDAPTYMPSSMPTIDPTVPSNNPYLLCQLVVLLPIQVESLQICQQS